MFLHFFRARMKATIIICTLNQKTMHAVEYLHTSTYRYVLVWYKTELLSQTPPYLLCLLNRPELTPLDSGVLMSSGDEQDWDGPRSWDQVPEPLQHRQVPEQRLHRILYGNVWDVCDGGRLCRKGGRKSRQLCSRYYNNKLGRAQRAQGLNQPQISWNQCFLVSFRISFCAHLFINRTCCVGKFLKSTSNSSMYQLGGKIECTT